MIDQQLAHLRATKNNIRRYRRLLQTELTDLERIFLQNRLAQEEASAQDLLSSAFPLTLGGWNSDRAVA